MLTRLPMRLPTTSSKTIYFLLFCAVLFTTIFPLLRINSFCIILLVAYRLWDAPATARSVFNDTLLVAYLVFVLIETAGFLHTDNMKAQSDAVAKDATLVAIAYVLCSGTLVSAREYRRLMSAYCLMIFLSSLYCLVLAYRYYLVDKDPADFFYHTLTRPIAQNAVFYSVYVVFAMLFLVSPYGEPVVSWLSPMWKKVLRFSVVIFFMGMIVLLSSKLLLVIAVLILVNAFLRRYSYRKNKRAVLVTGSALVLALGILALTKNPVSVRYRELAAGDLDAIKQKTFDPGMYFNALQLRLLEWRFGTEILNEQHAWLFGVSPGSSQDLLDAKYVRTRMYIGNPAEGPHRHIRGFIGYNFHNQYLETLVRCGFLGLAALLAIFILLFVRARKQGTREAWFVVLTLAVFFIPEAPLTMQQGVFLFCFFPLLAVTAPGKAELSAE